MFRTPTLTSLITVQWECHLGVERTADVVAEYTFDGVDDLEVLGADIVGGGEPYGIRPDIFDALVDAAVAERAAEAYGDWLSGQDGSEY
tara:strand:- start:1622 stop:1888 length:267 start_codon:yes stop_codon:yes gene_type:complete